MTHLFVLFVFLRNCSSSQIERFGRKDNEIKLKLFIFSSSFQKTQIYLRRRKHSPLQELK